MHHDGSSGGVVRIGVITKDGIERQIFYAPDAIEAAATAASTSGRPLECP